jgi:hypothetical protein
MRVRGMEAVESDLNIVVKKMENKSFGQNRVDVFFRNVISVTNEELLHHSTGSSLRNYHFVS